MPIFVTFRETGRIGQVMREVGNDWMVYVSYHDRYEYWRKDLCFVPQDESN